MFGSLRRFSLALNAFIASPFGLQRRQSDSPDSLMGGQCFEMARRQFDGVAGYSTCRSTRATGSIRRARWPPPVRYIGTKADSVFKWLSRRILDLADLRKLIARMVVPYRALSPSRTPFGNNPVEFAWPNRIRSLREGKALPSFEDYYPAQKAHYLEGA